MTDKFQDAGTAEQLLVSKAEAARVLGVGTRTVDKAIAQGLVRTVLIDSRAYVLSSSLRELTS